ncbi:MAG TPA: hypothetical protein VK430_00095 [Xanthobacteraceae bacterium]|nr:hypothetical protein [Xanthobacteraceae bacterium]
MQGKSRDRRWPAWLITLISLAIFAPAGLSAALAQDSGTAPAAAAAPQAKAARTSGSGEYYIEFRSRYAWDYGHTYIIHARVGEPITKASVAGLSPVGDDATAWVIGHYVPVPAETGWTDGDTEDKYVSARYRVYMNKAEYDRVMVFVRHLQATSHIWSAELYNCNAFVADIAKFMGLKVPKSTLIYPKVFVNNLRQINTHPEMPDNLVDENVKEMSNPTRDGRAMINTGVHTVREDRRPSGGPTVTIGRIRVTNSSAESVAASSVSTP